MSALKGVLMRCAFVAAWLALPRTAVAQTCSNPGPCVLPPPNPARALPSGASEGDARAPEFSPTGINYSDCVSNLDLTFSLQISNPPTGEPLQVWAGPWGNSPTNGPCVFSSTRQSQCWPVVNGSITAASNTSVSIRAQDVANQMPSATYSAGTVAACQAQTSPGPVQLGIYFMFLTATGAVDGTAGVYQLPVGTLGPFAPADVTLSINDGSGTVSWIPPSDSTIAGYYVYCQNDGDAGPNACSSPIFDSTYNGGFAVTVSAPTPVDAGSEPASSDASSLETDGGEIVFDSGVSSVPVTPAGISKIPASFQCNGVGILLGNTMASETLTLTNFDQYVLGVAAVDELGNVGPVGNVVCGTPGPVAGFWYDYVKDGGQAGGGYCALEGVGMPAGGSGMAIGLGVGAVGLVRRRRKPRGSRR